MRTYNGSYFFGHEVSKYGKECGYLDYGTLSKAFDCILCNDITKLFYGDVNAEYNEPELYNGNDYNEESDQYAEIFQYYIISESGAEILAEFTDEIVYYLPPLDMYIWGVTHWGTAWDYVLTDVKLI